MCSMYLCTLWFIEWILEKLYNVVKIVINSIHTCYGQFEDRIERKNRHCTIMI